MPLIPSVPVPLEGLAAGVARQRGLARVHPDVLPQLVGRVEALLAVAALEGAHLSLYNVR